MDKRYQSRPYAICMRRVNIATTFCRESPFINPRIEKTIPKITVGIIKPVAMVTIKESNGARVSK